MLENNQFDMDDPMNDIHRPVRLPLFKKGIYLFVSIYLKVYKTIIILETIPQIKSENSLEYPFQKNIYPSLNELVASESLMTLQVYLIKLLLLYIYIIIGNHFIQFKNSKLLYIQIIL